MTDAEFVKDARSQLGMTQAKFSATLGVSKRVVGMWENGHRRITDANKRHIQLLVRAKRKR